MFLRLAILTLAFYFLGSPLYQSYGEIGQDLTKEIQKLYEIQKNYEKYKMQSNWSKIYNYQHPLFKKKVSLEEFKFFDGKVVSNFRETKRAHVSGGYAVPSKEYISEHQDKKDILGFPAFRKFYMTSNKFININEIIIDKILISDNGKYSKSVMTYKGTQTLDPSIIRAVIKVPVSLTMENYWEKVGENWYITILISTTHLSGNTLFHNTPNDKSTWQNTKFFEFNSPSLGFGSLVYQVKK